MCYLPELGPALGAGRGLAARAMQLQLLCTAAYSYNEATGIQLHPTGIYKLQQQLRASAARAAPRAVSRNSNIA